MISDLELFPIMLLRQEFWCIVGLTAIYVCYKGRTSLFLNLQFLLMLKERSLNPESCLVMCCIRASCLGAYRRLLFSHNPDEKSQSLCCLVPIIQTRFSLLMRMLLVLKDFLHKR